MTKNILLDIAIFICKTFKGIYVLLFIVATTVFIHFQMNRKFYQAKIKNINTSFNFKNNGAHITKSTSWKMENAGEDSVVYSIEKIRTPSLYILYFQYLGILLFLFLSTKEFQKIMLSVKNLKTFKRDNVLSFRRIGIYLIGFFILTSFISINYLKGGFTKYNISLSPILFILFAFIMAEIFREGNTLKEENDLTI
ncbi:DUF2975 domain-containing protein [Polaribacter batillariae]|uniref:DUF2975 domain-containing protein n=1 Tax=Polaribacter batillariae TaxID=2808900 RepID=A0ABX7SZD3_9FLAO|nr:DUF2975 domain-containing protein [Polaribacter batillariae]QTD39064.1 DUF2975 domain-containing protein [Polaribacter batillariae]